MSRFLLLISSLIIISSLHAQSCRDASVELSATVQQSPPLITLNWVASSTATQYQVYRKMKTDLTWSNALANLSGTAVQYIDQYVVTGVEYEYKLVKTSSSYTGYGYICTGITIPAREERGTMILIVDSTFVISCASKISRLQSDLSGDGWKVIAHYVARTATVISVKTLIQNDYYLDPVNTKALFLLGHVPVPYSGNLNPDGHSDHQGAWPADVFYADIDGVWTDIYINNTTASDPRNRNIPGDGKFDQSSIPSDVELQTGRVDFANMPAFAASEQQLIQNYLDKDHDYRHKIFQVIHRGLVDDNFGYFGGEAFAASGWKNFGPLVGPGQVTATDYFNGMTGNSYLWSYGCGGGSYTSAGGIGTTGNFAAADLQGIFSMLFGSYFGDWDSQNNFLRAPLAQGKILTDVWSGRPHWQFHHMALGENIGYDVRVSQNNNGLYFTSYGSRFVHLALMGDPSLRNDVVAPVSAVEATFSGPTSTITWIASTDTISGYYIYRKNPSSSFFTRLNNNPVTSTTYTDSCIVTNGLYTYMIKAIRLQNSPSGTYYNLSQGISDTAWHPDNYNVTASATYSVQNNIASFQNTSQNALSYTWDFGDGTFSTVHDPQHLYLPGSYVATMIASNGCDADTVHFSIAGLQWNSLTGVLTYANSTNSPIANTIIQLIDSAGFIIATANTETNGFYAFVNIPNGNYTLNPVTTLPTGSINSTDALLALKHYVHVSIISGLPFKAGDVDNNSFINSTDALIISKRFTGQLSTFPVGDWYFQHPVVQLSGYTAFTQDLKGICYGDCNASYVP